MRITPSTNTVFSSGRIELIIWTLAFTTFAYVSFSISVSPLLIAISRDLDVSESTAGQLTTVGGIAATISALVSAPWMGRFPRRTWLRAELLLVLIAVTISALAPNFEVLLAGRVLFGIGGGALLANSFAAAGEVVTDARRQGRAIGIVASGTTVSVLAGVPLVAFLSEHAGWRWALGFLLIPLGISLAGTALLPTRSQNEPTSIDRETTVPGGLSRWLLSRDRPALMIILATGLLFTAYMGWITYYSAYVEHGFANGTRWIGLLFIVGGLAELIGNFGAPALSHRAPVRRMAILGMIGVALSLLGSGIVFRTVSGLFVAIASLHLFTSLAYVGLNTMLVRRPARIRGAVLALSAAASGLGSALGALAGGVVLAWTDDYERVFHVMGGLMVVGAVASIVIFRAAGNSALVENGIPLGSE